MSSRSQAHRGWNYTCRTFDWSSDFLAIQFKSSTLWMTAFGFSRLFERTVMLNLSVVIALLIGKIPERKAQGD
jgi:hypothetical protein